MAKDSVTLREDYLRAIHAIALEKGKVRSVDVAKHLHVTKASVSIAVSLLTEKGYLVKDEDHYLHLTEEGRNLAEKAHSRSEYIRQILLQIGVDQTTAQADASRIARAISEESLQKLTAYFEAGEMQYTVA